MLEGEALDIIDGVPFTEDGYAVAVQLLHRRFGDQPRLQSLLWSKLHGFPVCASTKVPQLRRWMNDLEKLLRLVEKSGVDLADYDSLAPSLFARFPASVIREIQQRNSTIRTWTFVQLRDAMEDYMAGRELVEEIIEIQRGFGDVYGGETRKEQSGKKSKGSGLGSGSGSSFRGNASKTQEVNDNSSVSDGGRSSSGGGSGGRRSKVYKRDMLKCILCETSVPKGEAGAHTASSFPKYATRQGRIDRLKELNRCLKCGQNHATERCDSKSEYQNCHVCKKQHHVSSCPELNFWKTSSGPGSSSSSSAAAVAAKAPDSGPTGAAKPRAPQLVADVYLKGPKGTRKAKAFLDEGSNQTWIDAKLKDQLGLPTLSSGTIRVKRFHEPTADEFQAEYSELTLLTNDLKEVPLEVSVLDKAYHGKLVVPAAPKEVLAEMQKMPANWFANDLPTTDKGFDVEILIGSDHYHDIVLPDARTVLPRGYVLVPSRLGLLFAGSPKAGPGGRVAEVGPAEVTMVAVCQEASFVTQVLPDEKEPNLARFFGTDIVGICEKELADVDEETAIRLVEESTKFKDGRYEVCFPWRPGIKPEDVPDNYGVAIGRLHSLERNKFKDRRNLELVNDCVIDQLERDVIERVDDPSNVDGPRESYLAHSLVVRPGHESTETRHVFDCSECRLGCAEQDWQGLSSLAS